MRRFCKYMRHIWAYIFVNFAVIVIFAVIRQNSVITLILLSSPWFLKTYRNLAKHTKICAYFTHLRAHIFFQHAYMLKYTARQDLYAPHIGIYAFCHCLEIPVILRFVHFAVISLIFENVPKFSKTYQNMRLFQHMTCSVFQHICVMKKSMARKRAKCAHIWHIYASFENISRCVYFCERIYARKCDMYVLTSFACGI